MAGTPKRPTGETTPCPWCSAMIPIDAPTCPACGAALRDAADGDVAGVTRIDIAATTKLGRLKQPGRLATWLGAERTTDNPALAGRIEPPSDAVKQEMLRLELAAIDAEIEAKNALLAAERLLPADERTTDADVAPADSAPADPTAATATDAGAEPAAEPAVDPAPGEEPAGTEPA